MALQVAKASTAALAPWEEGVSKVEGGIWEPEDFEMD